MTIVLAPDVYVNASVAPGMPPEVVARRLLQPGTKQVKTTSWILDRVEAMLNALPGFKKDAVEPQLQTIRLLVDMVTESLDHSPDDWQTALVAAAKAAGVDRVLTDHPDLAGKDIDGVQFVPTEAWLLERSMPPPPPSRSV